jgi:hypothetical protein
LYLAEGSSTGRQIVISLDQDEKHLADRFSKVIGVKYGKVTTNKSVPGCRTRRYHFHRAALADWFGTFVGKKDDKIIPEWMWHLGKEFMLGVVEGMILGDGYIHPKQPLVSFVSTRVQLAVAIREIVCSLGFGYGGIHMQPAGIRYGRNCQQTWTTVFCAESSETLRKEFGWDAQSKPSSTLTHWYYSPDKTSVYVRIRKIEEIELGTVYDIEVESDDHLFRLPGAHTHNSEVSRWPSAEVWTADIEPSLNARDMLAIMESTAYGRNGLFYNQWKAAEAGKSEWIPVFIPVYKVRKYYLPLRKGEIIDLTDDEKALRSKVKGAEKFTIPLGFFKWRRKKIIATENATGSDETHFESYPVTSGEAFINSGLCAFPKKGLNYQERANCKPPMLIGEIEMDGARGQSPAERLELPPKLTLHEPTPEELMEKPEYVNRFWVWEEPDQSDGVEYYVSSDVASGDGGDYTTAIVYRIGYGREPHVQVASWHGLIDASAWAYVLAAIAAWYHMAEIAVEYTGFGITTGNDLFKVIDFPNLYRWKKHDRIAASDTSLMHWQTTSKTRPDAISRMFQALTDRSVVLLDKHLIEEMRDFARYEGEIKVAGIDNNDDMVMAAIIGLCALYEKITMSGSWSDSAPSTQSSQHMMPKVPVVFAIYDHLARQVQQVDSLIEGQKVIGDLSKKHGIDLSKFWRIVPVVVQRANTIYSPIYDGSGAEHELYDRHGVDPKHMTPDIVHAYRDMLTRQHYEGEDD